MNKGIKFRIYPDETQKLILAKTFGCCRLVYNKGLAFRINSFKAGEKPSYKMTSSMLTDMKHSKEFLFLNEVDSIALQQSLRDLDRAYRNFFDCRSRYPKFKSKHNHNFSYRTINQGNNIRIENGKIKLPKVGFVKIKQSMQVDNIHSVTIEQSPSGKYYAVIVTDFTPCLKENAGGLIGLDVGIKTFCSDSNGLETENPKHLEKAEKKLARLQRKLSRKVKGSKNYEKQRIRVACAYEKVTNRRDDFLHNMVNTLISENQVICVENLNIKGMIKNHKLAKHIQSASWGKFVNTLEYKSSWYGNTVVKVPTKYPSSQLCSCCGYKNPLVKNLSVRAWTCPNCGTVHERDKNAAINILSKGLSMLEA